MDEEINAIERNKAWDLVELPKGKEVIGVQWVYKTKSNPEGKIERHKARLVVKGYKQQYGRDCEGTFAPVARMETESKVAITPTVMGLKLSKEDNNKDFDHSFYKSIVGSLMYLTVTRPDIMHVVSLISRFMVRPKEAHWQEAKRIVRYVKGTKRFGILYTASECSDLIGYTDSDWPGSVDDRKSTSGYVFHMGSGAISWASKKQSIVALSTTEAEYVAATAAACQAVWMRRMLRSLWQEKTKGTMIFCDKSSAIALSKNFVFHKRMKHIDIKIHYIREFVNNGEIILKHCKTQEQVVDILTKPLGQKKIDFLRKCLGMTDNPAVETKGEC
eukprot:PITA_16228